MGVDAECSVLLILCKTALYWSETLWIEFLVSPHISRFLLGVTVKAT